MSTSKTAASVKKVENKKKSKTKKVMGEIKSSTQRSKTTVNWHQFLLQQNKDITVKKPINNNRSLSTDKNKMNHTNPKHSIPVDPVAKTTAYSKKMKKFSAAVAIDCEMVGIGDGRDHMLARVSLVDENGYCLYDTFVKAMEPVSKFIMFFFTYIVYYQCLLSDIVPC